MDKSKVLYLIMLDALGRASEKDSAELLHSMQSEKDFPWKEMGEYQNLSALLSLVVKQEFPSKKLKEKMLGEIERIGKSETESAKKQDLFEKGRSETAAGKDNPSEKNNMIENKQSVADSERADLKIVDHAGEFEEVKSKLFKIKDRQKETFQPEFSLEREDESEKQSFKKEKPKKNANIFLRKKIIIAAGLAFLVIVLSVIYSWSYFNEDIEEQKRAAVKETEELISKSRIQPEEQKPFVKVENIEPLQPSDIQPDNVNNNEKGDIKPEVTPESIKEEPKIEPENPVLPLPETPDFIEAPLIIDKQENMTLKDDDNSITTVPQKKSPPPKELITNEEPVYFVAVEEMPAPIGGIGGIQEKIVYPELAKRAGIEGKVLVLAFVDESGNVTKAEVIKGIGLGCDEAAIDAIFSTKFKPGMQRGKPVKVQITIPVTFKL